MQHRGYLRIAGPESLVESDTIMCGHCNRIVPTRDPQTGRPLDSVLVHCHQCDTRICVACAEKARCTPFEKQLEAMETRARLRAAAGV